MTLNHKVRSAGEGMGSEVLRRIFSAGAADGPKVILFISLYSGPT